MKNSLLQRSLFFMLLFPLLGSTSVSAQSVETSQKSPVLTKSIAIQFNPYIDQSLFTGNVRQYVFALRYSLTSYKGFSFGPEFSGYFGHSLSAKWQNYNFGVFFRYTFLQQKKVSPFVEVSGYYQTNKMMSTDPRFDFDGRNTIIKQKFSYYIAPGITIPLYKKKLMLDFFIKCSTDKFLNGRNFIPSIRIVWRF